MPDLHSELCNQVVLGIDPETRSLRNFNSPVDTGTVLANGVAPPPLSRLLLTVAVWSVKGLMYAAPQWRSSGLGTKLEDYVLNPRHREGRHKARLFESALGITLANTGVLRQTILSAADIRRMLNRSEITGTELYVLRFALEAEKGSATVLTAWIVRDGEDFPRLVTCYIL